MPNQPACLPCKNPLAQEYLTERMGQMADLKTIRHELASAYRKRTMGYGKAPTLSMLVTHQKSHIGTVGMASAHLPTFSGEDDTTSSASADDGTARGNDVAAAIQQRALQALADGELRVTAQHGLKAEEMIDKRAERAQDRELTVFLARMMTQAIPPPALMLPDDAIEAEYTEVELSEAAD